MKSGCTKRDSYALFVGNTQIAVVCRSSLSAECNELSDAKGEN